MGRRIGICSLHCRCRYKSHSHNHPREQEQQHQSQQQDQDQQQQAEVVLMIWAAWQTHLQQQLLHAGMLVCQGQRLKGLQGRKRGQGLRPRGAADHGRPQAAVPSDRIRSSRKGVKLDKYHPLCRMQISALEMLLAQELILMILPRIPKQQPRAATAGEPAAAGAGARLLRHSSHGLGQAKKICGNYFRWGWVCALVEG